MHKISFIIGLAITGLGSYLYLVNYLNVLACENSKIAQDCVSSIIGTLVIILGVIVLIASSYLFHFHQPKINEETIQN